MLSNGKHEEAIVHVAKMCMLEGCMVLLEKTEFKTSASEFRRNFWMTAIRGNFEESCLRWFGHIYRNLETASLRIEMN